jgi:hypothetical protein
MQQQHLYSTSVNVEMEQGEKVVMKHREATRGSISRQTPFSNKPQQSDQVMRLTCLRRFVTEERPGHQRTVWLAINSRTQLRLIALW